MGISFRDRTIWGIIFPPLLVLLVLAGTILGLVIPSFEASLLQRKKEMIRELTYVAWSTVEALDRRVASGELTPEQARKDALEHIRAMRYGDANKDYFWINDLSPVMLMHPYRPDLEGKDISSFQDSQGNYLFRKFVQEVTEAGEGYVSYWWQWKDDPDRIVPKLSFVKLYQPWGWVIGTGIYTEDVRLEIAAIVKKVTLLLGMVVAFVGLISVYIIRQSMRVERLRQDAEAELKKHHAELDTIVQARTSQLKATAQKRGQEILERKHAEAALRASEERFRDISLVMADWVWETDSAGRYTFASGKVEEILGYAPETLLGKSPLDLMPEEEAQRVKGILAALAAAKQPLVNLENWNLTKDGRRICLLTNGIPLLSPTGKLLGYRGVDKDITWQKQEEAEKKTMQDYLFQQEKLASVGQLAAGVAHEINNPLGFIASNLGSLQKYVAKLLQFVVLQGEAVASGPQAENLATVKEKLRIDFITKDIEELIRESLDGTRRITDIVQNLKSFSRLDEAKHSPANLNDCLENTIKIAWNELKYKAEVVREYGTLPMTLCYPQQLNQVFLNLLVNAAQAIEDRGTITIKTWSEADTLYVAIGDTGAGIPAEQLSRIFEPFFTTKAVGKGTGLGLSISYDIVQKHHGQIMVESTVGAGTTFTVRLPVVAP